MRSSNMRRLPAIVVLVAAALSTTARATDHQVQSCPPGSGTAASSTHQGEIAQLRQKVEAGPFYKASAHQFGTPQKCEMELNDSNIRLTYYFSGNAKLEARIDPTVEYSEQRLQLPGMKPKRAIALLKEGARDSFGQGGCRIDWSHPTEEGPGTVSRSREAVYRGDVCNCQGRLLYQANSVTELVLRSAC